jgi:hypothetical protein
LKIRQRYISVFFILFCGILLPDMLQAQLSSYYWSQSFNSVSSMLSGAVVAGDGGSSSVYYNPANLSEAAQNSNLSVSAAMFTWRYYKLDNLLGKGISPESMRFTSQPQFITYVYQPSKSHFTLGATVFTRLHQRTEINYDTEKTVDILKAHPGAEQYNAYFDYRNRYDDTWVGIAGAYEITPEFHLGVSFFVSSVSLQYLVSIENTAVSQESSGFTALYHTRNLISYSNFRGIFKIGATYQLKHLRLGLNITTPSFNALSISKKLLRTKSEINITHLGKPLPDEAIFQSEEGKAVQSNERLPLSLALGMVYNFPHSGSHLYFSMEHFFRLKPYLMLEAFPHPANNEEAFTHQWLSVASGSKSITNAAIGFSWENAQKTGFMLGFRTDFNYLKNLDFGALGTYYQMPFTHADLYHITGGAQFRLLGQKVVSGLEFTFGQAKKQRQLANFSDPVEYNAADDIPLQGPLHNTAVLHYYAINLYLSAVLNFGGKKKKSQKAKQ